MKRIFLKMTFICFTFLIMICINNISYGAQTSGLISDSVYNITNKASGKSLNVNYGSDTNGTNINQYTKDGSIEQFFKIVYNSSRDAYKLYAMCSSNGSNRVLDIYRPIQDGANVDIWTPNDNDAQDLIIINRGNGYYSIHLKYNSNLALTSYGTGNGGGSGTTSTSPGNVFVANYTGASNQLWAIKAGASCSYYVDDSSMVDKFITKEQDTIQLSYEKTKNNKDIYISSENDEYIYMNDVLVGYIKDINIDTINNTPMKSETAKIIAENFLNDNISDFEKYEFISNNYIEAYAEYSVIFMNKLNGFNTNDIIRVNINNSGIVVSFSRFHYNEFEKYNNIVFNMENIENMIINEIKEKYGNSYVNSEIKYSFLNLVNKKLVLQIEVNVELNQGGIPIQTTEIVFYEL